MGVFKRNNHKIFKIPKTTEKEKKLYKREKRIFLVLFNFHLNSIANREVSFFEIKNRVWERWRGRGRVREGGREKIIKDENSWKKERGDKKRKVRRKFFFFFQRNEHNSILKIIPNISQEIIYKVFIIIKQKGISIYTKMQDF